MHTTTQLRSSAPVPTRPLAHAITMRLLPVNSSAPATTTSNSPSENARPPSSRDTANPGEGSLATSVNIIAPSPMKAPPSNPSRNSVGNGRPTLSTPMALTRWAISRGE